MRYRHLTFAVIFSAAVFAGCQTQSVDLEQSLRLAGELRDNKLYRAAADEYRRILDAPGLSTEERANVAYLTARVYFEDLHDYANAAAFYLRARSLNADAPFASELSTNLVASLERMGQHADAKRQLGTMANMPDQQPVAGDPPVAQVGERTIYRSEIDKQIQTLPDPVQKQLVNSEAKQGFVRQYVGVELLYQAAVREKYADTPELQEKLDRLKKKLVVEQYVLDKVMPQVQVDTTDVRTFYQAHKDDRYRGLPYDSVRAQVFMDYQSQKTEAAYSKYLEQLAAAEKVQFFDQNIR